MHTHSGVRRDCAVIPRVCLAALASTLGIGYYEEEEQELAFFPQGQQPADELEGEITGAGGVGTSADFLP